MIHDGLWTNHGRQRQTAAQPLAKDHQIWLEALVLETTHHAAAAESDLHFVNDDENAMTAAPLLQRLKEPHRWHDDAAIRHQRFDEALISLELFLKRTVTGTAMRAAAEDFNVVRLVGIPASRIIATAFLLSGLLAGIASMLWIAQHASVDPLMGSTPVLKAFIAAVVGGLGSLRGAVAGGFLLGISEVLPGYLSTGA
jgi:hypothetical protein